MILESISKYLKMNLSLIINQYFQKIPWMCNLISSVLMKQFLGLALLDCLLFTDDLDHHR